MVHVVTQSCCSDASCVIACPVNAIHPGPTAPGFAAAEMVFIDPQGCVDCGACVTACPVDAIKPHTKLTEAELPFIALNASYFVEQPHADRPLMAPVPHRSTVTVDGELRVAVVGSGPAGMYAADELLRRPGVTVDVLDRLEQPYGLARFGVAPDHRSTRKIADLFATIEQQQGFDYLLGVDVGRDVSHADLQRHYDAVFYTVGASSDRSLDVPGEQLPGSESATEVVGWYNGHPDHEDTYVDLGSERVVIVGNGNVALDVARILTADPDGLADTDIAPLALACLRGSRVREVVLLGRRGPGEAAFTMPELVGLAGLIDIDVVIDNDGHEIVADSPKTALLAELAARVAIPGRRRIVLRFRTAPVRILGDTEVTGIEVERTELVADEAGVLRAVPTGETEILEAGMVIRSVGYRGRRVPDLPFDEASGTVPNSAGRVEPGVYVAGWIKRGPSGFIGTNKSCAEETVSSLLDDLQAGRLTRPTGSAAEFRSLVRSSRPSYVDLAGWRGREPQSRGWPRVLPWRRVTTNPATVAVRAGSSTTSSVVG